MCNNRKDEPPHLLKNGSSSVISHDRTCWAIFRFARSPVLHRTPGQSRPALSRCGGKPVAEKCVRFAVGFRKPLEKNLRSSSVAHSVKIRSINSFTFAASAPGVSVGGIITSLIATTISFCAAKVCATRRHCSPPLHLQRGREQIRRQHGKNARCSHQPQRFTTFHAPSPGSAHTTVETTPVSKPLQPALSRSAQDSKRSFRQTAGNMFARDVNKQVPQV
jgi:hypothetical protein